MTSAQSPEPGSWACCPRCRLSRMASASFRVPKVTRSGLSCMLVSIQHLAKLYWAFSLPCPNPPSTPLRTGTTAGHSSCAIAWHANQSCETKGRDPLFMPDPGFIRRIKLAGYQITPQWSPISNSADPEVLAHRPRLYYFPVS